MSLRHPEFRAPTHPSFRRVRGRPSTRRGTWLLPTLLGLLLPPAFATPLHAAPTLEFAHLGDVDPEDPSEGWTRLGFASPGALDQGASDVEIGPRTADPGCSGCGIETDAWGIDDRSGLAGTALRYEHTPSSTQAADALALGWTLRARLRVASHLDNQPFSADPVDDAIVVEYSEGTLGDQRRYRMSFGGDNQGDPIVALSGSADPYISQGGSFYLYVLYELIYRPDLGTATLFVDGVERLSDYAGEPAGAGAAAVAFGSDSDAGLGRGHFEIVEWEIGLPTCFDGQDNDGDGLFDLADPSCLGDPNGATEDLGTQCDDATDNDGDGLTDLADPSCLGDPSQDSEDLGTECDDHLDNDGDGHVDLADPTCAGDPGNAAEQTACDDGIDNDADGRLDLDDAGCLARITRDDESGELVVDTTLDKIDVNLSDGICETDVAGECSLRAALMQANATPGLQGVQLPAGMFELTIAPSAFGDGDGDLDIRDDLALIGAGAQQSRIGGDATPFTDRVLDLTEAGDSVISGVTIQQGASSTGAGIRVFRSNLTLVDSAVSGNSASSNGGGLSVAADLVGGSHVELVRTTVTGNTAAFHGGGFTKGFTSTMALTDSTVSGNSASLTGGIFGQGFLTLTGSTVSGNTATSASSGGAGIAFSSGTLSLVNSTVSGNTANGPVNGSGGIHIGGEADATLANTTVTGNAPNGVVRGASEVAFDGSIVAANSVANCGGFVATVSLGHNLSDDGSCDFTGTGDLENTPALLGPLADNGGPTWTHLLLPGSPALDAGDNAACPAVDQRGTPRPLDGDDDGFADCDIGAIELPEPGFLSQLFAGIGLLALLDRRRARRGAAR